LFCLLRTVRLTALKEVNAVLQLQGARWSREGPTGTACFPLERGVSTLEL
jgi:hypothetical protein